ncbi:Uncharacterised protein [Mycobacteroides abscessus subsp. abscessus]|nr:Uncharacterised protein [Mycobacteroides abscessus subsp. abscessus]
MGAAAYPAAHTRRPTRAAGSHRLATGVSISAPARTAMIAASDHRTDWVRERNAPAAKLPATPATPITSRTTPTRSASMPRISTMNGVT